MTPKKPRLVLLPGMDGTGLLFSRFIAALPPEIETQVISYRDDEAEYASLLQRLEHEVPNGDSFVLIAESFSTPLAVRFAAANPDGLEALVLVAGFVSSPVRRIWKGLVEAASRLIFRIPLTAGMVRWWLLSRESDDSAVEQVQGVLKHLPHATLQARLHSVLNEDAREALKGVSVPVLYLQGERDRLISSKNLEGMQAIKPTIVVSRLLTSHLLLQTKPEEARDEILTFCVGLSEIA